jgi:hypothetical protein
MPVFKNYSLPYQGTARVSQRYHPNTSSPHNVVTGIDFVEPACHVCRGECGGAPREGLYGRPRYLCLRKIYTSKRLYPQ